MFWGGKIKIFTLLKGKVSTSQLAIFVRTLMAQTRKKKFWRPNQPGRFLSVGRRQFVMEGRVLPRFSYSSTVYRSIVQIILRKFSRNLAEGRWLKPSFV